jgi:hypothetical protein
MSNFIQAATARMKRKGTLGKFGKATAKKISAGKKAGGVRKKEAVFAENMKHIARRAPAKSSSGYSPHNAIGSY